MALSRLSTFELVDAGDSQVDVEIASAPAASGEPESLRPRPGGPEPARLVQVDHHANLLRVHWGGEAGFAYERAGGLADLIGILDGLGVGKIANTQGG